MKYAFRSAVIFASCFIIAKLIFFNAGWHSKFYVGIIFINILMVLLAMVYGMWMERKHSQTPKNSYLEIVKSCMRPAMLYVLLVTAFVYLYYNVIDQQHCAQLVEQRMAAAEKADFAEIQKANAEFQNMTRNDFLDRERENAEKIFSPFAVATATLFGLVILSFFYSLVVAWVFKRFFIAGGAG